MKIQSMTGFGRGVHQGQPWHATVEISSVNRKQLELVYVAPREWSGLESQVRALVLEQVSRGRVQVNLHMVKGGQEERRIEVDAAMARALDAAMERLSVELGRELRMQARDFLAVPGIIRYDEGAVDLEGGWASVEPALREALRQYQQSRRTEGVALSLDLKQRVMELQAMLSRVQQLAGGRSARHGALLRKRLADLDCPVSLDDERVLKEIALYADRCDISEEVTRLDCHLKKFLFDLECEPAPGRSLDFLCQEIHREWNTVGSKAMDAEIGQTVVAAKAELEKIREQVQNVE